MKAMLLKKTGPIGPESTPLDYCDVPLPVPGEHEVRLKILTCGVCHTELDEIEGRTPPPRLPVIPGHEVVGVVDALGTSAGRFKRGERLGVGWIHHSTGTPTENVDAGFVATGRDVDGGYAEYMTVPEGYAYRIPETFSDEQAAPLLCAGGVGYRAIRLSGIGNHQHLGLTGFGGSAHLVLQLVRSRYPETGIYVFARDKASREFALELGATWAGDTTDQSPVPMDAIIDTTPAWKPVVAALSNLRPGGRLVINAIRKEDNDRSYLENISYENHLWMEKEIKTVANVTATDIEEFLALAAEVPLRPEVQVYDLKDANTALRELKAGKIKGAKVLRMR